jgi:WD40 repeat protein
MSAVKASRIFVSSPGDVSEERALTESVLRRLGEEYRGALQLNVVLWEHEPVFAHAGYQQQIARPSECDLVICILWSRLGTRLPEGFAPGPGESAPTGTEYEIRDALEAYRHAGKPNLLIYRKTAAPQLNMASAEARERLRQYELLEEFCRRTFYDAHGAVIVAHTSYGESYEFERRLVEHVRRWLATQVGEDAIRARWTSGSPYRGLQAFEAEHREIYFGRSQALSELIGRLRDTESRATAMEGAVRFLMVQGMSGNGKSSLIRAGLLPLLEGRALEGIGLWRSVIIKPSDRPEHSPNAGALGALTAALAKAIPAMGRSYPDASQLAERLRQAPAESAARLDGYLTQEALAYDIRADQIRLVVFIDQFEELFEQSMAVSDRSAFIAMIHALAREGRVWIIATMRSDFAARIEDHPDLVALTRGGHLHILGPPQSDELADMIREPAQAAGLRWETQNGVSLDQAILREATASPESLPLLEYVLDQLYERHNGKTLTYADYKELGGLKGGIAQSAETVLANQQGVAASFPNLMRSLVSVDDNGTATRRYAPLTEFASGTPERALLDALVARRLCVADQRGNEAVVSFAHEALILSWPRVTDWLKVEAGLLQTRELALRDTRLWQQHSESEAWLATADKLVAFRALEVAKIALPEPSRKYLERSRRRVRRMRRVTQLVMAGVVGLALTAVVFGLYVQRARTVASRAIAAQFEAKSWDLLRSGEMPAAVRYALASTIIAGSSAAASSPILTASLLETGRTRLLSGHSDFVREAAFSPSGHRVLTASEDHTARIWDANSGQEIARLIHDNKVWQASFSPDGARVITASGDNVARVWDTGSGRLLLKLEHGNKSFSSVLQAIFSPDSMRAATVSSDGTGEIWDIRTGHSLAQLNDGIDLFEMIKVVQANLVTELRHGQAPMTVPSMTGIRSIAFSPDGHSAVTASTNGKAQVWDNDTGKQRLVLKHDDVVTLAQFSPEGRFILTASRDHTARVWSVANGQELARFTHDAAVSDAAFSPDGREVVTASEDGTARIWDATVNFDMVRAKMDRQALRDRFLPPDMQRMKTAISRATRQPVDTSKNRELARLQHDGKVNEAKFSPDGRLILTASNDHTARLWDSTSAEELARLQHGSNVNTAAFSSDTKAVVTTTQDDAVEIWDISRNLGLFLRHDADVQQAVFSHDGRYVLTASDDHTARVWEADSGRQIAKFDHSDGVRAGAFSNDGRRVVLAAGDRVALVWDVSSGREIGSLHHNASRVRQAAFSPDGDRVITAGEDTTARIWNATSGEELARFTHGGVVNTATFSPDGRLALTSSADFTARLWDAASGQEVAQLKHDKAVRSAKFSGDGLRVVTASDDHTARIWDATTGKELLRLSHDDRDAGAVRGAEFSLDNKRVVTASADGTARVWDATTGQELARFKHEGAVLSAAFSPDGLRVVTASNDHTARVWDVSSGRELILLQRARLMRQAAFAPDGGRVLTVGDDAARLWDVTNLAAISQELYAKDCDWLPPDQRRFTPDEIQSDALVRDVFLSGGHYSRSVCNE